MDYKSLTSPFGDDLKLTRFSGEERLSGLFRFEIEARSPSRSLDFSSIVGKHATITVNLADGTTRYLDGIVGRFLQAGGEETYATYHAVLHPWLWLLTFSADCRIFQNLSAPDIISKVFDDLGFSSGADYKKSLKGTYQAREYCVQYNETAFHFVSRLMEEEGMHYFFEHSEGRHTLVLADDPSAWAASPGARALDYGTYGLDVREATVTHCTLEENIIAGTYAVDDFSFETPSTDLMTSVDSSSAQGDTKRRIYAYPGGFLEKDRGDAIAQLRLDAEEAPLRILRGESLSPGLITGYTFTLQKHYRDDVNADYAVTRLVHDGGKNYSNSFEAIPKSTVYRPPLRAPKPRIAGTQTAIVVGKSGEEIWPDKYGRVKVQFHWDQVGQNDENSSCWIRVAHGWAGTSWGQIFLPRLGQEVVVSFLEGDPDRPLITGAVYNAEKTVPYTLPDEKTKSTVKSNTSKGGGGYNEIRFEDNKDQEEVYVQAQRDMNRVVKNNDTLKVGFDTKSDGDQTIDIYNNRTVTIDQGNDALTVKTGDRTIAVQTGNETHDVAGTRDVTVTKAETRTNEDAFTQEVTKDHTLKVSGNLTIDVTGSVTIKSGKAMTIQSGDALTAKASSSLTNQAGSSLTNKAGTSLTNQAGTSLDNKAGTTMTNQASASQTVDGGGMLTVKGGIVKIN